MADTRLPADFLRFAGQLFNPVDFKITIDNFSFPVHKHLLTEKSGFFRALCSSQFREAQSNEVALHEDNPANVARMITWMYHGGYNYGQHFKAPSNPRVSLDQLLKAASVGEPSPGIDNHFSTIDNTKTRVNVNLRVYLMADKYDCPGLREYCIQKIFPSDDGSCLEQGLWPVVDFIKETAVDTKPLKDRMCVFLSKNLKRYVEDERFEKMTKEIPDLALQIFKELAK